MVHILYLSALLKVQIKRIRTFSLNPFHLFNLIFLEVPFIDGDIEHDFVEGEVVLAVHRENAHVVVKVRLL